MTRVTVVCSFGEPFDLFGLPELVKARRATGAIPGGEESVEIEVRHPDREAEGSCRWCGCREDEVLVTRVP